MDPNRVVKIEPLDLLTAQGFRFFLYFVAHPYVHSFTHVHSRI